MRRWSSINPTLGLCLPPYTSHPIPAVTMSYTNYKCSLLDFPRVLMMILVSHYAKDVATQAGHGACEVVTDEKK